MSRTDEFLNLYKELEQALKLNYVSNRKDEKYENYVMRFINSREGAEFKDELNSFREIRNLLQHLPKMNGHYLVEPSSEVIDSMKQIIDFVEHPKLAIDIAVRGNQIYKADINTRLTRVTKVMTDRGFSHVPVFEENIMAGVLSVQSVFEYVSFFGTNAINKETRIADLKDYYPIEKHRNETFLFIGKETPLYKAADMFEDRIDGKRVAVIYITENGKLGEPLLGLLTPWLVIKENQ